MNQITVAQEHLATAISQNILAKAYSQAEFKPNNGKEAEICVSDSGVGITEEDINTVVDYALAQIGDTYDLQNILDLARFLISSPPVPGHLKRRLLALGSGDPTKTICSSMIAQAFQAVQYPILPERQLRKTDSRACRHCYQEILHIKHHSLFVPRDFDASPYFEIVKPTIYKGFNPYEMKWSSES